MKSISRITKIPAWLEANWSLYLLLKGAGIVGSFALPAWAASAVEQFQQYAPLSWIAAGFVGMLIAAMVYGVYAWASARMVKARYDAKMLAKGSFVDPMAKTYEDVRIYLNEFCLPSHPVIQKKTFINCQIIGPANIILEFGNNVQEAEYPISDAVRLKETPNIFNAVFVRNCIFRQCSFQRITFLVPPGEYENAKDWQGFNWITPDSPAMIEITSEGDPHLQQQGTAEETPQ
tara:strand:+ start:184 stop:882 length:699 start_codon:yes stop_codon:yes gene_type:complete